MKYVIPPLDAVLHIINPTKEDSHELQDELQRLVIKFTLCSVIETLGVVCEVQACSLHENDGTAHRMRTIGLALIDLSGKCYAL